MTVRTTQQQPKYGDGDASFRAAGGVVGLRKLVNDFYDIMEELPEAREIRDMHPADLTVSRDKLSRFLCGWLGGPKLYREKYGEIRLPSAHAHLDIGSKQRDAWLACMQKALENQPYCMTFKTYLIEQLYKPAERSRTGE